MIQRTQSLTIRDQQIQSKQKVDIYKKPQILSCMSNNFLSNYICIPFSGLFWTMGYIFANDNKISPIEANLTRYLVQLIFHIPLMWFKKEPYNIKSKKDTNLILIRSTISGLNGFVVGIFMVFLPLTVYYTLGSILVVFSFLLNYYLFQIPITKNQVKSVFVSIVGILLVINGRFLNKLIDESYQFTSKFEYLSDNPYVIGFVSFCVIVWSLVWAYGIVITGKHHVSIDSFIFMNSLVGFFMFSILQMAIPIKQQQISRYSLFERQPSYYLQTVVYTGIPLATANYLFNVGLFISPNTGVSTMMIQINILISYFFSTFRYNEQINIFCALGGVLMLGSLYVILIHK